MLAVGDRLCMLDADDLLEPDMLARSVAALDADPSVAFASHWLRTFGEEQGEWTPTSCEFPALLDMNTVNGSALVRRTALESVGGFDETFLEGCEDWDLWITMVAHGFRGVIIPEFLFRYRRRTGSMSQVMMEGDTHPALYRRLAAKHAATGADLPAQLFLAAGGLEEAHDHRQRFVSNLYALDARLRGHAYPSLASTLQVFEGETHMSVFPAAVTRGLGAVFGGYPDLTDWSRALRVRPPASTPSSTAEGA